MKSKFKKGQLVILNVPEPVVIMTINKVIEKDGEITYECVWIEAKGKPNREIYTEEVLKLVPNEN